MAYKKRPQILAMNTKTKTEAKTEKTKDKKLFNYQFNFDLKTLAIIAFISIFLFYVYSFFSGEIKKALPEKPLSQVVQDIKANKVKKTEVIDNKVIVYYNDDKLALTYKEPSDSFRKVLSDAGVNPDKLNMTIK